MLGRARKIAIGYGRCARAKGELMEGRVGKGNRWTEGEAFENKRWKMVEGRGEKDDEKENWPRGQRGTDEERLEQRIRETKLVRFELISFAGLLGYRLGWSDHCKRANLSLASTSTRKRALVKRKKKRGFVKARGAFHRNRFEYQARIKDRNLYNDPQRSRIILYNFSETKHPWSLGK